MKAPVLKKIKNLKAQIKTELGDRYVDPKQVETVGKALYDLAKVFSEIDRESK